MTSVSIIDDHKVFTTSLKNYLENLEDIQVVIEENDPYHFLEQVKIKKPDIAIVDLYMSKMDGATLIRQLREKFPEINIIVLSMCLDLKKISRLIDMGIHSYISKYDDVQQLKEAIYAAGENRIYKNKLFTDALYWSTMQKVQKKSPQKIIFSDREVKMLQLLWQEKTNKEIAAELFLGIRSIEKIRQDMKERLGVKTTIGLIKYALSHNIISDSNQEQPFLPAHHFESTSAN